MPGGGEIGIKAFGSQNKFFNTGNPQMSFFNKVYQYSTHFSKENIEIALDGPNLMLMDAPIRLSTKIPRHADLLTDLVFVFDLPDIYSKVWAYSSSRPNPNRSQRTPSFRWIQMIGAFIIDTVSIIVGGTQIQSFPGEWIAVRATADMTSEKYAKWCSLVGHTPELNNPEWGVHGKSESYPFKRGDYPHAIRDPSDNVVQTPISPSVQRQQIRVPLPFWFTESWGAALPLVALQRHDVEVQIQMRPLRDVYRLMDDYFQSEPARPGRRLQFNSAVPTQRDPTSIPPPGSTTNFPYTNLTLQTNYQTYTDISGTLRNFYTDPTATSIPRQDGFIMNAHLEGTYVYVTREEQVSLVSKELSHLVHQVQLFSFPSITGQQRLDLDVHGLLHRIIFFARRSDAQSRNDYLNLSNWKYANQAPYWPLTSPAAYGPNSGKLISYAQRDILKEARLLLAGNEIQAARPASHFEVFTPFMNTTGGTGLNPGTKPDTVMGPLYQMSFALNASDHTVPSGSLNASMIKEIQLEVTPWNLDPYSTFSYDFSVYCESENLVRFTSGMAGLAFAI